MAGGEGRMGKEMVDEKEKRGRKREGRGKGRLSSE